MNISATTGTYSAAYEQNTGSVDQDSQVKAIQIQIQKVQQEIQSLSANDELSSEEKLNKQKELQQQLQNLNNQLTQRKTELQQEKTAVRAQSQETVQKSADLQVVKNSESTKTINSEEQENAELYQAIEKQEKGQYVNLKL